MSTGEREKKKDWEYESISKEHEYHFRNLHINHSKRETRIDGNNEN